MMSDPWGSPVGPGATTGGQSAGPTQQGYQGSPVGPYPPGPPGHQGFPPPPPPGRRGSSGVVWVVVAVAVLLVVVLLLVVAVVWLRVVGGGSAPTATSPPSVTQEPSTGTSESTGGPAGDYVAAQRWASAVFGTFEPVTLTGTGSEVVQLPGNVFGLQGNAYGMVTFTVSNAPDDGFSVVVDSNAAGEVTGGSLVIDGYGNYTGTGLYGHSGWDRGEYLRVDAPEGSQWEATIEPVSAAPEFTTSGSHYAVMLYTGAGGDLTVTFGDDPTGTVYWCIGQTFCPDEYDVLDLDTRQSRVTVPPGPALLTIESDMPWETSGSALQ